MNDRGLDIYRPIPFWSWNDKLEVETLKEQIHWMHENRIGGFFMHARAGLETPYLSEEWMKAVEACCKEANKLGMQAWIYDENGWPSGFAGGRLLEHMENRDRYIVHKKGAFDGKADVSYLITEEELIPAVAGEEGKEYLNLYIRYSASTVDILNPDVVDQFLSLTHEQYRAYLGEAFPKLLQGFFTDEPQYYRWGTPYTPMLEAYFWEQYGENIREKLGLLFVEKRGYREFRYRYWLAMQTLMLQNFAEKVYHWCESHGVSLTGHYIEESSLGYQMMCCGGVMPFYAYEHVPGIDCLGRTIGNPLPAKQVGSAARQLGKKQVLTESFAGCGWDVTPGELRRIAGYQYANGVNRLCQHLVPYSERGERKHDYPAHFTLTNPWTKKHFKEFNDYFTNLGYLLGEGEEPVNVAVLHPIRSAYFDYKREEEVQGFGITELEESLQEVCGMLAERGINYHFLDETLLERYGFVRNARIGCGKCEYEYLILPALVTMGRETERFLRSYIEQGGKMLVFGGKPKWLEGESFDYPYLKSNVTWEELAKAQPFVVEHACQELCYAYRIVSGRPFLYVQNLSERDSFKQQFFFPETERTCSVTLAPGEDLFLYPDELPERKPEELRRYQLRFCQAPVSFEHNFLTVDAVRYSTDGCHYSEKILCEELFEKLLKSRYEGELFLQYEFEIETLPEQMYLFAETKRTRGGNVNGHALCFEEEKADITSFVQAGNNVYEVQMDWHQREETYFALFGEAVTEGLKNCVVYESELADIYLAGKFGVYSHAPFETEEPGSVCGQQFFIGEVPQTVSEPTTEGFPFFRGDITMKQQVILEQEDVLLEVEGRYVAAEVSVNGQKAGTLFFGRCLDISRYTKKGENEIAVTFTVGNRNLLGPFHHTDPESFISPDNYKNCALPKSEDGEFRYKLLLFYEKEEIR